MPTPRTLVPAVLIALAWPTGLSAADPAPVVTPATGAASCTVAPGYALQLVASEPMISEPVQIAFDPAGRLWVVEMRGFMTDATGSQEDQPSGRISVLEDLDGDGVMDKATVFLDGLVLPRSISLVAGGVVIAEPPNLWYCRDRDGDLKCDEKKAIFTDYGKPGNPEHTANGLLWAMDNWLYSANHGIRYRFTATGWTSGATINRGQWGIGQDDAGMLVYNANSDPLRGDVLPADLATRNRSLDRPAAAVNVALERDLSVWPDRATPGVNRAYRPGTLRKDGDTTGIPGSLARFTAACGPWVYRGDLMPDLTGNVFFGEPSANLVRREVLSRDGYEVKARNPITKGEFITSGDERFRPVNFTDGPDGALYLVDMYKGLLQHRIFLTPYLKKHLEERGLDKPANGLGRIYRLVPAGVKLPVAVKPTLDRASTTELIAHLGDAGGWWRDTAQRLLVERHDLTVVPALHQVVAGNPKPLARVHALWTLDGLGDRDPALLVRALADADGRVRGAAVRIIAPQIGTPAGTPFTAPLVRLANDPEAAVRLLVAAVLGPIGTTEADQTLADLLGRDGAATVLREAAVSGLGGRELAFLEVLSRHSAWTTRSPGKVAMLQLLAKVAGSIPEVKNAKSVETLATSQEGANAWRGEALRGGLALIKTKPTKAPAEVQETSTPAAEMDVAAKHRISGGEEKYLQMCAACHQPAGEGQAGLAPPLAGSSWVTGPADRTIKIILHGLEGPVTAAGTTFTGEMPPMGGGLDDAAVADIVSYLRNSWGHRGSLVDPAAVAAIRAAAGARGAWTAKELGVKP